MEMKENSYSAGAFTIELNDECYPIAHDLGVKNSTNAKDSLVVNNSKIISQAKKYAFWVSLITGVVSSLIASLIFHLIVN